MFIFVDCEFTDFIQCDLISIGLVAEDGREIYGERSDYSMGDCSDFSRWAVLPQLGRYPGCDCTFDELASRVRTWLVSLGPVDLVFDYATDWDLLHDLLTGDGGEVPSTVGDKRLLGPDILGSDAFQRSLNLSFSEFSAHHALHDARALRLAYLAYVAAR